MVVTLLIFSQPLQQHRPLAAGLAVRASSAGSFNAGWHAKRRTGERKGEGRKKEIPPASIRARAAGIGSQIGLQSNQPILKAAFAVCKQTKCVSRPSSRAADQGGREGDRQGLSLTRVCKQAQLPCCGPEAPSPRGASAAAWDPARAAHAVPGPAPGLPRPCVSCSSLPLTLHTVHGCPRSARQHVTATLAAKRHRQSLLRAPSESAAGMDASESSAAAAGDTAPGSPPPGCAPQCAAAGQTGRGRQDTATRQTGHSDRRSRAAVAGQTGHGDPVARRADGSGAAAAWAVPPKRTV